jgi:hypothetical protein
LEIYPQINKQFYKKNVDHGFLNPKSSFSVTLWLGSKVGFLGTGQRFGLSHILRKSANTYAITLHTNVFEEITSNEPYIKSSAKEEICLRSRSQHAQKAKWKVQMKS